MNGSTALHCAVYFGQNKIKTVRELIENGGANLNVLNHGGASILSNAVKSVDSNADVVRYLLSFKKLRKYGVNHRRKAQTAKWKIIYTLARSVDGIVQSSILKELASESGSTTLYYAVRRGDMEIVELLMEHHLQLRLMGIDSRN